MFDDPAVSGFRVYSLEDVELGSYLYQDSIFFWRVISGCCVYMYLYPSHS
jgi:hypothetical protein